MKPFIFNELFQVNTDLHGEVVYFNNNKILIVDNFLKNFTELQNTINQFPPGDWKYAENTRNYIDYYDCKIMLIPPVEIDLFLIAQDILKQQYNVENARYYGNVHINWFKQINLKQNDYAWPHKDNYVDNKKLYTFLLFLNSKKSCSGGTIFFNNLKPNENNEQLNYWGADKKCWEKIGHINMEPNRLLVFPSDQFHSAYHPENSFFNDPRLTLVFQLG